MNKTSKMTLRILATSLVITAGFAASAATDGAGDGKSMKRERPSFSLLDVDGNGQLTREELAAHGKARFERFDANGDGLLSKEEMMQQGKRRAERRAEKIFKHADANGDGLLSFEEMNSGKRGDRMGKMFERMDADENGTISEAEFAEMGKHRRGKGWGKKHAEE